MASSEFYIILFGLCSALFWGAGDFSGGLASRRTSAYSVVALSQFVSLLILLAAVLLVVPEPFSTRGALLGSAAGISGAIGLVALYTGLSRSKMGMVAPLTAVIAAVIPVLYSLIRAGAPSNPELLGILIAFFAVWLISSGDQIGKLNLKDLGLPLLAGLGFGIFFIVIADATEVATLWPLVFARISSVVFILLVGMLVGKIILPDRQQIPLIVIAGIFDTGGNLFYIFATRFGRLDIAAVLSSFYPAATVFLARLLLKEQLTRHQWVGVVLAILAVVLIAI